jgi:hypothetical protein
MTLQYFWAAKSFILTAALGTRKMSPSRLLWAPPAKFNDSQALSWRTFPLKSYTCELRSRWLPGMTVMAMGLFGNAKNVPDNPRRYEIRTGGVLT